MNEEEGGSLIPRGFSDEVINRLMGLTPRSMLAGRPVIVSGHLLPRYGTILRRKYGIDQAMFLGKGTPGPAPMTSLIWLNGDPITFEVSEMTLMREWEIVEESKV